ncbi:MAG: hypothetical protein HY824_14440 [Acidobacteria bacterium]|nr:hypothetical protein [Acidobacteriota bacterium]
MRCRSRWIAAIVLTVLALASLEAAIVSRQNAETFAQKVAQIRRQGEAGGSSSGRRTALSQDELNSWFAFDGQTYFPAGVTSPQVTIVGDGRVAGQAVVDLEAMAKRRSSGGGLDPWKLVGGRVPVSVAGILHTRDGMGRLEVQSADISGLPVPPAFLQELITYYSRTPERPQGVRLDDTFPLPAGIRQIEVGQGQAVVVQ